MADRVKNSGSGVFPNYINLSTTDNKGINDTSTNEEYSTISIIRNNAFAIANRFYIKREILSKEDHLTIAST
jgi:hypothetical protein